MVSPIDAVTNSGLNLWETYNHVNYTSPRLGYLIEPTFATETL